jgi:hypothetical protein
MAVGSRMRYPDPITACSGNAQATTAWFSFTATATKHWMRTDGQGTDDARMEVFSGGCGNLSSIGCFPANGAMPALTGLTVGVQLPFPGADVQPGLLPVEPRLLPGLDRRCLSTGERRVRWGYRAMPVVPPTAVAWPSTEISSLGATQIAGGVHGGCR